MEATNQYGNSAGFKNCIGIRNPVLCTGRHKPEKNVFLLG